MRSSISLLALMLVTSGVYLHHVRTAAFVFEDANAVWQHPGVTGQQPIDVSRARWLTALSHRLVWTFVSHDPQASHAVNLALHLLNGLLVYLLIGRLAGDSRLAVIVSALFLLHRLQTEAVAYVASRSELLSTALALLAALCIVRDRPRWAWTGIGLACLALALAAKESAIVMVPLIAFLLWTRGQWRWGWMLACLVPMVVVSVSVWKLDYRLVAEMGPFTYAATQAAAVWRYLAMTIVPYGQSVDHDWIIVPMGVRWACLYGLVVVACIAGLLQCDVLREDGRVEQFSRRAPLIGVGLVWMLIGFAPRFVMRVPELLTEHHTYLPFIGVWIVLGIGLQVVGETWLSSSSWEVSTS